MCFSLIIILFTLSGGSKSSWRITVRQLESMCRLSEAMARMHCSEEVHPKHVQEAFRLLNKSIIRVETPEINFGADEPNVLLDQQQPNEEDVANGVGGAVNGNNEDDHDEGENGDIMKPPATAKKLRVTYEQYRKISNVLIFYLKKIEDSTKEGKVLYNIWPSPHSQYISNIHVHIVCGLISLFDLFYM